MTPQKVCMSALLMKSWKGTTKWRTFLEKKNESFFFHRLSTKIFAYKFQNAVCALASFILNLKLNWIFCFRWFVFKIPSGNFVMALARSQPGKTGPQPQMKRLTRSETTSWAVLAQTWHFSLRESQPY